MEILILALVFTILGLAIVGFISLIRLLFKQSVPAPQKPTLEADVLATRRFVEYLKNSQSISSDEFQRVCDFLESKFPEEIASSAFKRQSTSEISKGNQSTAAVAASEGEDDQNAVFVADLVQPNSPPVSSLTKIKASVALPRHIVDLNSPVTTPQTPQSQTTLQVAPWDRPDPPPIQPRRTFGEMISGFMQERNMRWGELASGILIVLSAIGLVVSLRNELNARIPYFSSLLFLLITAGIIGAGIYTLKRWRLRNTSRGALIIGLLLIPLNFVSACVLSDSDNRRGLDDPWYWAAVVVGLAGGGCLSWFGAANLLKRNSWPLASTLVGSGAATLAYHRFAENLVVIGSSFWTAVCLIPSVLLLMLGTGLFDPKLQVKRSWTERGANRLLIMSAISLFAVIASLSVWFLKDIPRVSMMVATSPILVLSGVLTSVIGRIVHHGTRGQQAFYGLAMQIFGLIVLAIFMMVSSLNPTIFVINCLLAAIVFGGISFQRKWIENSPVVWGLLTAAALMGFNLFIKQVDFDGWMRLSQVTAVLVNGKSALCLLVCGICTAVGQFFISSKIADNVQANYSRRLGWLTGGSIFIVGCGIALLASVLNRDSYFDTMTATGLLLLGGVGGALLSVVRNLKRDLFDAVDPRSTIIQSIPSINLAMVSMLLTLVALVHGLWWNPTTSQFLYGLTKSWESAWGWILVIHGLFFGLLARLEKPGPDEDVLLRGSMFTTTFGMLVAIAIIPIYSGNATIILGAGCIAWFLICWTEVRNGKYCPESTIDAGVPFVFATSVLVVAAALEFISPPAWGDGFGVSQLFTIFTALAGWGIFWTIMAIVLPKIGPWSWLVSACPRTEQYVVPHVVAMMAGTLVAGLAGSSGPELFNGFVPRLSLYQHLPETWLSVGTLSAAVALMTFHQPTWIKGLTLIVLWLCSWGLVAACFEPTHSTASALRWLIPASGLIFAILMAFRRQALPAWIVARKALAMPGRSRWYPRITQSLIDVNVWGVILVLLMVSTITVARVMLTGPTALGGPFPESWFNLDKIVAFGMPILILVSMLLIHAISEQRSGLAMIGSMVFQYLAVLATFLLLVSPYPALATEYFIRVLQASSIGMTLFGLAWFWFRDRIHSRELSPGQTTSANHAAPHSTKTGNGRSIVIHTLINGLLISALSGLAMTRYYWLPDQSAGWIAAVGSTFGVAAVVLFGGLLLIVWSHVRIGGLLDLMWIVAWFGLILLGIVGAGAEHFSGSFEPWLSYRIMNWGAIGLGAVLLGLLVKLRNQNSDLPDSRPLRSDFSETDLTGHVAQQPSRMGQQTLRQYSLRQQTAEFGKDVAIKTPFLITIGVALAFAVRGAWSNSGWQYESIGILASVVALTFLGGIVLRQAWLMFLAGATSLLATYVVDSNGMLPSNQPSWFHWSAIVLIGLAIVNLLAARFISFYRNEELSNRFVRFANFVQVLVSVWILVAGLACLVDQEGYMFGHRTGAILLSAAAGLSLVSLWNDYRWGWVFSFAAITLGGSWGILWLFGKTSTEINMARFVFAASVVTLCWGLVWAFHSQWMRALTKRGGSSLNQLERSMQGQLPHFMIMIISLSLPFVVVGLCAVLEHRTERLMIAAAPLLTAAGLAFFSNSSERRWLQHASLGLATMGVIFVSWTELEVLRWLGTPHLLRTVIVLGVAMFIYGGLIPRWVREKDSWLKTFREMSAFTGIAAVAFLAALVFSQWLALDPQSGSGVDLIEAVAVSIVCVAMVYGLIVIAVRPDKDPFSLSIDWRKGYVYMAQLIVLGLVLHVLLAFPKLFQMGLKEYWPYIAMGVCFAGATLANLLKERKLEVLSEPLVNTAAIIPIGTALGFFAVNSAVDGSVLMLVVGIAYGMIGFLNQSWLSGALSILFANLSLWMLFPRLENMSFWEHPQWWLIPPALSTLIATQFNREALGKSQTATIRYFCAAVIYISSTSEIFLSGMGDKLWPPIVLAMLSIIGIFAGIMLQVRAYLYFGMLFLLMAMISMVAHAHKSLNHVWPWWAFGIVMGIGILIVFGLFEKRKQDLKKIAGQFKEWDA